MTESTLHVAVAGPVVTEEWRDDARLPMDDSPVFTGLGPLMVVVFTSWLLCLLDHRTSVDPDCASSVRKHGQEAVSRPLNFGPLNQSVLSLGHGECAPVLQVGFQRGRNE